MIHNFIFLLFLALLFSLPVGAKKYPFKIDVPREVVINRSTIAGSKMVKSLLMDEQQIGLLNKL